MIDQLKQRLIAEWEETVQRLKDSVTYQNALGYWSELNQRSKVAIIIVLNSLILMLIISPIWNGYQESQIAIDEFIEKKEIMRALLLTSQDLAELPKLPLDVTIDSIKLRLQNEVLNSSLLSEQVVKLQDKVYQAKIFAKDMVAGLIELQLKQLNLRQVVQIGVRIEGLSEQVKKF